MDIFRLYFFVLSSLVLALFKFPASSSLSVTLSGSSIPASKQECREVERSALLEFKESLRYPVDSNYADHYGVEPEPWKIDSWRIDGGSGNCCTWNGVECDPESGHVMGLELCCTGLHATINSTSKLFRLVHLRKLNLAYTNFDQSHMPSSIHNLPKLSSLNLSASGFMGQIPREILGLANLSSLDLSYNPGLKLVRPSLGDLLHSLTKLEELDLSQVNVSSSLRHVPANLSSIRSLVLKDCGLHGHVPSSIFAFPNLLALNMSGNFLSGHLPEFPWSCRLKSLCLSENNFTGKLPESIGNLTQLIELDLSVNGFQGPIPSFANKTQLKILVLKVNQLTGSLPSSLGNLFQLQVLRASSNNIIGHIPPELFSLSQLAIVHLSLNMLSGTIQLNRFLELSNLKILHIGFNKLSVVTEPDTTASPNSTNLAVLAVPSCNLRTFPRILEKLHKLSILSLASNNIIGEVPSWFQQVSRENLLLLNLSFNSLTGFSGNRPVLRWRKLAVLDLSYNNLKGELPLPPESIITYHASDNRHSGEISPLLCSRQFIQVLNLARNYFTGEIPECFTNLTKTLYVFSLQSNNLHGRIPEMLDKNCSLRMLDLSNNQLQGPLPRTMSSCSKLEFLNFRDNMIEDTFPSWLGGITSLMVLILRSNLFHGAILEPASDSKFLALRIIDLSSNNFEGRLPATYFHRWKSMTALDAQKGEYIGETWVPPARLGQMMAFISNRYVYGMAITNKGVEMEYAEILDYFQILDFSSNNFSGDIPNATAILTGLRLLNFSNNILSGPIPPFLSSLKNLEALDLSKNRLSGEIPQQLTGLNFLAFFDVSDNNLSRRIRQGNQFDSFKNTSYEGNEGLCGFPLSKTCSEIVADSPSNLHEMEASSLIEWKGVVLGYVCGFVVAAIIGHKKADLFGEWMKLRWMK